MLPAAGDSNRLEVVQDFGGKTGFEASVNVFPAQQMSLSLNSLDCSDVIGKVAIRM